MKKLFFHTIFSLFFIVGIFACSTTKSSQTPRSGGEITTTSGLKYNVYQSGTGISPQKGDLVTVHYVGKLENDTIFDSSRERGEPFQFKLGEGQVIKGWDEGIAYLNVGDRATLTIPPNMAYGNKAMQKIPANSTLIFDVELLSVTEGVRPYIIEGKDTNITSSGLKIIKLNELPNSNKAQASKNVTVHYSGYLSDGKIFDSSVERGDPITFPLGTGKVIKGWDEGIANMRVGEKARLIIPPHLGYGENGYPPVIPKNATLFFDVELVNVED